MTFSAPPALQGQSGVMTPEDAFVAAKHVLPFDVHLGI
jgi:hypothetical protein